MIQDEPMAYMTKWVANLEMHEEKLLLEKADLERKLESNASSLGATQAWIEKMKEMLELFEGTNEASLSILGRQTDETLKTSLGTHFERIRAFLVSVENTPQSVVQLSEGTGIPRTSLSAVLYRTHSEEFKFTFLDDNKRGKLWSLKKIPSEQDIKNWLPPPPISPPSFEELAAGYRNGQGNDAEIPF
ncbi:MAG TPA: hypothetical protein VH120_06200 [Gemmataceae bacterium]|jgi:hypothetical protein|nr:hypothetical protein [Gemmataceae bacterium]